jgi:hypothetical protein
MYSYSPALERNIYVFLVQMNSQSNHIFNILRNSNTIMIPYWLIEIYIVFHGS